ncbi:MAG: hypothetical protein ACF8XB_15695 [Planctomycetota bacterium JB042]
MTCLASNAGAPLVRALLLVLSAALAACSAPTPPPAVGAPARVDPLLPGLGRVSGPGGPIGRVMRAEEDGNARWSVHLARRHFAELLAAAAIAGEDADTLAALADRVSDGTPLDGAPFAPADPEVRARLREAIGSGDLAAIAEAASARAGAGDDPRWDVEAAGLEAHVERTRGDATGAGERFLAAAETAAAHDLHWHDARLLLLADEATAGGSASWPSAVGLESQLAKAGLFDPLFWGRAIEARGSRRWPDDVIDRLADRIEVPRPTDDRGTIDEAGDTFAWLAVGDDQLERGDPSEALVAFRRAAEGARTTWGEELAGVGQARALVAANRMTHARTLLTPLAEAEEDFVRSSALAQLGAIELAEQRPERAITVLESALELGGHPVEFRGRSDALANLGLALLSSSRRDEGLERLHEAQRRYRERRDVEGLVLSLLNERDEAAYAGASDEVARLDRALREAMGG